MEISHFNVTRPHFVWGDVSVELKAQVLFSQGTSPGHRASTEIERLRLLRDQTGPQNQEKKLIHANPFDLIA